MLNISKQAHIYTCPIKCSFLFLLVLLLSLTQQYDFENLPATLSWVCFLNTRFYRCLYMCYWTLDVFWSKRFEFFLFYFVPIDISVKKLISTSLKHISLSFQVVNFSINQYHCVWFTELASDGKDETFMPHLSQFKK